MIFSILNVIAVPVLVTHLHIAPLRAVHSSKKIHFMLWCKSERKAVMNILKPEVMEIRQMLEVIETCKRKLGKFGTGKWLTGAALTTNRFPFLHLSLLICLQIS